MSRWLALARNAAEAAKPRPDTLTEGDKSLVEAADTPFCQVLSGRRAEESEQPPGPERSPLAPTDASPYGTGCGGLLRTWTGKIVSLDDWRNLTEWERHGSTGKMWNGLTRRWEDNP